MKESAENEKFSQITQIIAPQSKLRTDFSKSRSEISWLFGIEAMNIFTAHYQAVMPLDYANLPYWDLCAALRQIRFFNDNLAQTAAFFIPYGRKDITPSSIKAHFQLFIHQALTASG